MSSTLARTSFLPSLGLTVSLWQLGNVIKAKFSQQLPPAQQQAPNAAPGQLPQQPALLHKQTSQPIDWSLKSSVRFCSEQPLQCCKEGLTASSSTGVILADKPPNLMPLLHLSSPLCCSYFSEELLCARGGGICGLPGDLLQAGIYLLPCASSPKRLCCRHKITL